MEVKLVITPSEEMVQLVDKVINAFARGHQLAPHKDNPALGELDHSSEKEVIFPDAIVTSAVIDTAQAVEKEAPKRRRTKAEIEAEKQAETAGGAVQDLGVQTEGQQGNSTGFATEESVTETSKTAFVADVVKLRKMTVRRSELIGDVPSKLLEFGYNSVTSLAKDTEAAEKYFNYLVSVSPISVEDNA